ncbi:unnamed protein product [Linum trigynum]|uniref:Uncharacterized protein n=1 Tax=Linum trigynum TaxID=586398 RepID=A0AAV2DQ79_9ROSI
MGDAAEAAALNLSPSRVSDVADGFSTPKGPEHRIPEPTECPWAPKPQRRPREISVRRTFRVVMRNVLLIRATYRRPPRRTYWQFILISLRRRYVLLEDDV